MDKVTDEIYSRIDNLLYNSEEAIWWESDSPLHLIKLILNPVRLGYIRRILFEHLKIDPFDKNALEVGSGGGILCEEIAKMGFITTGVDPSEQSLNCASNHAKENGLLVTYKSGNGEALPFQNKYFDVVFCCDVLEHVRDLPQVISEISRVLKPGGIYIYDTFNRTAISKLVAIKVLQEWKRWAIMPADLHVWEMFIRPDEIKSLLFHNDFEWKEHRGIKPDISVLKVLFYLHQRALGKLSYEEFGQKFRLTECNFLDVSYMGYAIKRLE